MWKTVRGLPSAEHQVSRVGMWEGCFSKYTLQPGAGEDHETFRRGASFLNHPAIHTIEDWGCGSGDLARYLAPHQAYMGIDGSRSHCAALLVDLEIYRSSSDGIFVRHVLEHNPNWKRILCNAVVSFNHRMVLVLFTPYQQATCVLRKYPNWMNTARSMWDIGFRRDDITENFAGLSWYADENLATNTQYGVEHVFYIERCGALGTVRSDK